MERNQRNLNKLSCIYEIDGTGIRKNMEDPQGACLLKIVASKIGSHYFLSVFHFLGDMRKKVWQEKW